MSATRPLLLLAFALALVACSEPPSVARCSDDSACAEGVCRDGLCTVAACTSASDCAAGEGCADGSCTAQFPCAGRACELGRVCRGGGCVETICTSGSCQPGESCSKGRCVQGTDVCANKLCAAGKVCRPGAEPCVAVTCAAAADCASDEFCEDGLCRQKVACDEGKADCNLDPADGCEVDLRNDPAHCGGCGEACEITHGSASCEAGHCGVQSCEGAFADCDGKPETGCETDTATSADHCGTCGTSCAADHAETSCGGGSCAIVTCEPGFADCDGDPKNGCEVNLQADSLHCGTCAIACAAANGAAACVSGACAVVSCDAGFDDCDDAPGNGCEVALASDGAHCGGCGTACSVLNGEAACVSGTCAVASCAAGFGDCDHDPKTGCEVATTSSVLHCGGCGHACVLDHATAVCAAGGCAVGSCEAGWSDCDGDPKSGCEVNTAANPQHCGSCTYSCSLANAAAGCSAGACTVASCGANHSDCDGDPSNGCEVDTSVDVKHCGTCSTVCSFDHAAAQCRAGSCAMGACEQGWSDCNDDPSDGCEKPLDTTTDCGSCGTACSPQNATGTCASGTCAVASCNQGRGDCDGDAANGCETDTLTSLQHCGACNNACGEGQICSNGACAAAGTTCKAVLDAGRSKGDGLYSLDPCGTGASLYWCDMTTNGGGWTVAGWQAASAKTNLGVANRGTVGNGTDWSKSLACVPFTEVMVFNRTYNLSYSRAYPQAVWNYTATNMAHGTNGNAFKQGTYGPSGSLIMMGCVDYGYSGGLSPQWGCDNDSTGGAKGHLADYAGEYCAGGRLDNTWAWSNGTTCSYRGQPYTWGFAIR